MKQFTGLLLSDIELLILKMYLLGNHLKMHLNSWIFPDVRKCIAKSSKYKIPRTFCVWVAPEVNRKKPKYNYWYSSMSLKLCSAAQRTIDEDPTVELDVTYGCGKGIYLSEQGDHGNTSARFGFTQVSKEGLTQQGQFYIMAVLKAKDKYENVKSTVYKPLADERTILVFNATTSHNY